jgi:RNA polymerase sigma-70 factor, ECF subfamily
MPVLNSPPVFPDAESRDWVTALRGTGPAYDRAVAELHALLLRAAHFEIRRRSAAAARLGAAEVEDLAQQSADDALVAVLAKLGTYRGASRFTTWAYKFALLETGVKLRRKLWEGREVPIAEEGWTRFVDARPSPQRDAETAELLAAIRDGIERDLTPHQRRVLVQVALNEVPIDVLAERWGTTRGALYKTLHDARRKLRQSLAAESLDIESSGGTP